MAEKGGKDGSTNRRRYWCGEIEKAKKRYRSFWEAGDRTIDEYRLQKGDDTEVANRDKYNILYSTTETTRPNLYAQRPVVRTQVRNKDRASETPRQAALLLGSCLQYIITEQDFDEVMENAVEDLILPGIGVGWVRYAATTEGEGDEARVMDEEVLIEYVYWKDFLTGPTRGWHTVPWVARRLWVSKDEAEKRWGKAKANKLKYAKAAESRTGSSEDNGETAEVWEIWDKASRNVYWVSEDYPEDILEEAKDPLKLKNFFPCPKPLRAISNTRTFVPRALYSQYKSQADMLNQLTRRIRLLTEALRVVGVYDSSQAALADLLNPNAGNKMVAVDSWVAFAQTGGIKGSVEWLPVDQVVTVLMQLLQAREVCKNEIYEITGFSDIVRGLSKASETLGAQQIKTNWASARVKKMQKEVQRFARDLIAIAGEVVSEHCTIESIALYGGVDIPPAEAIQADPALQQKFNQFQQAFKLLRNEGLRCAKVDIETDSTILADEEAERQDRMAFLGAAGAFLQQAVPAIQATPQLGPLLGSMLMFTVRTFPSSQPIEDAFEQLIQTIGQQPPTPPPGEGGDNGEAAAQSAIQTAQIKAASDSEKTQADAQLENAKLQQASQEFAAEMAQRQVEENNRHEEKLAEIALKRAEIDLKRQQLGLEAQALDNDAAEAERTAEFAERDAERDDARLEYEQYSDDRSAAREDAQMEIDAAQPLDGAE